MISHLKSKQRKLQLELEKQENPATPAPKKGVKAEPKRRR